MAGNRRTGLQSRSWRGWEGREFEPPVGRLEKRTPSIRSLFRSPSRSRGAIVSPLLQPEVAAASGRGLEILQEQTDLKFTRISLRPGPALLAMSVNPMVYETQFFGFTPQTFMLQIYMAFQDHLAHLIMVVEEAILNKREGIRPSKLTPSVIRRGTEQFFSFTKQHFSRLFDKMEEMFLKMVLSIPKNVLLPEDHVQEETSYTAEQFQELRKEIEELEGKVKAEISAEQALRAELEQQKVVQGRLEGVLQWFESLDNAGREEGTGNLRESLAALTKTSVKLRHIVQEVNEKMNHLENKK